VDLNAIFQRSLASKAQSKTKLYSRFQIFQDVCEADIEIADCKELIDFTRCKYSICKQNSVHILMRTNDDKLVVKEYLMEPDDKSTKKRGGSQK
jgi:hypothetical protein